MQPPPIAPDEAERLIKLASYEILDTEAERSFDDLVHLAAFVCDTPISAITLVDSDRQWFNALVGLEGQSTDRDVSFCGHALAEARTFVVPDALNDERFFDNPLVVAGPQIRFYAGTPLVTPDGFALGTLCVVDRRPRNLTDAQLHALERLGRQCVQLLESRLANQNLRAALAEREFATAALQASQARLQAISESALDAIVAADTTGTIISWNFAAERIFGHTREAAVGQPLTVLMPPRFHQAHQQGLARMAATGQTKITGKTVLLEGLKKDGSVFDLELSLGSWLTPHGRFFSGIMRDVTASCQAAKAIREERDFTAAVLDATDALIVVLRPDGTISRFNKACETASGYKCEEVLGRAFDFLLPPEESVGVVDAFVQLTAGSLRGRFENHWMHKDGSKRLIAWSNAVLTDAAGAVLHVIGTGIDITEQRRAEHALSRQSAIMSSVLQNMGDGVLVTDEQGQFVLFNDAAQRMLGRGPEDGAPDTWPEAFGLYLPDRQTKMHMMDTPMARALRGEYVDQFEIFMRAPQFAEGRWHSVTSGPVSDSTGKVIGTVSVGRDITDRKHAQELLAQQAAELRSLALKDELTGLNNRRGFLMLCEQQLRSAARGGRQALLIFIDLDGMKHINDQFGHEEGDNALRDTAQILLSVFRQADIVARLGGDEFVALVFESPEGTVAAIRKRLDARVDGHNAKARRPYRLAMSVGAATFEPSAPQSIEALLASADALMYEQKHQRRARKSPEPNSSRTA